MTAWPSHRRKRSILPLSQERRRFQRVRVNLLGRYMLADRREFPCQVTDMSPGGMALIAPVARQGGRARHRLCRSRRPARGRDRAPIPERLRHDHRGDPAQARQARRPAHLARQPSHPRPAGRPPPRPCHAAQSGRAPDPAERRQRSPAASSTSRNRAPRSRPTSGPRSARWSPSARPPGRVVRHLEDGFAIEFMRAAASGLSRRERHRWVNGRAQVAQRGPSAPRSVASPAIRSLEHRVTGG